MTGNYISGTEKPQYVDCIFANLEGDKLYLLVNDEEKDWGSRSIIEFQMEDSVIARRHYTLTGCERISHFVVKKDTFVVFDHAAAKLKYYPIPY